MSDEPERLNLGIYAVAAVGIDYDARPLTFRIKWEHGQWWCYSKGFHTSYFCSERLDWMCNAIAKTFPKRKYQ